jgi:biotin carboxyl carrier protein
MRYLAKIKDKDFTIEIIETAGKWEVQLNGSKISIDMAKIKPPHLFSLLIDNKSLDVEVVKNSQGYVVHLEGKKYECVLEEERRAQLKSLAGFKAALHQDKELRAPMPGLILAIEVKEDDLVKVGQGLVIVEAMKMENEIKAKFDAKVKAIKVKPKQTVEQGEILIVFE